MEKDRNNVVVDNFGRVYKDTGATLTDTSRLYVANGANVARS